MVSENGFLQLMMSRQTGFVWDVDHYTSVVYYFTDFVEDIDTFPLENMPKKELARLVRNVCDYTGYTKKLLKSFLKEHAVYVRNDVKSNN